MGEESLGGHGAGPRLRERRQARGDGGAGRPIAESAPPLDRLHPHMGQGIRGIEAGLARPGTVAPGTRRHTRHRPSLHFGWN